MMLCVPAVRLDVWNVAAPELSVPVPSFVVPSRKVTVPVGEPPLEAIVPVKVTACPVVAGFSEEVRVALVVDVGAGH